MSKKQDRNTVLSCVSFDWDTLKKADEIVAKRLVSGVRSRSGLIQYALEKVFKEVFKEQSDATRQTCQ